MIGVEFCAHGSLQSYLQEKRSLYTSTGGSRGVSAETSMDANSL